VEPADGVAFPSIFGRGTGITVEIAGHLVEAKTAGDPFGDGSGGLHLADLGTIAIVVTVIIEVKV